MHKVLNTQPVRLKVVDEAGSVLKGSFYTWEVQKITKHDRVYRVDDILKERTRGGRKQILVPWRGYPSSMNNTLAHFTTHLPHAVTLEGSWELGLAKIQYPQTGTMSNQNMSRKMYVSK